MNNRFSVAPILIVIFSTVAFSAGYFTYPFVHETPPTTTPNLGVFWEAWNILNGNFFGEKPNDAARINGAIHGMVESFDDPYTVFVEPHPQEIQNDSLRGKFGGIGAQIEQTEQGFFLKPIPDQPAAKAGILNGDQLMKVDGEAITVAMTSDDVVARVRGEVGSEVALNVRRLLTDTNAVTSTTDLDFTVVRAELELPSIQWQLLVTDTASALESVKIGYIHQSIFSERSPEEMVKALKELRDQGADHFIWDLRGNPGGRVDSATQLADIWLDSGVIVREKRAGGAEQVVEAKGGGEGVAFPLVIVADGSSASASEIVTGAMQDNQRAKFIGQRTFGKGSVQLLFDLSDGSSLHVTNAQWFTPNGNQISGKGLEPDLPQADGVDPLLAAIDVLLNR